MPVELLLSRSADAEWREVVRPWLRRSEGRLERALAVAPGRGRLHALKLRCVSEGLPLLGVEFLTPRLARRKWEARTPGRNGDVPMGGGVPVAGSGGGAGDDLLSRPPIGRELLLLGLKAQVAARLAVLKAGDPARGLWKSLESDLERAVDDFDDLVRAGFTAADFPLPELRAIFGALEAWVDRLGFALAPAQAVRAGLTPVQADPDGGRLLVLAGGPEGWGEFFSLAALARRSADLTVVLSEPDFRGRSSPGEAWAALWQALLGVEPRLVEDEEEGCAAVAEVWSNAGRRGAGRTGAGRTGEGGTGEAGPPVGGFEAGGKLAGRVRLIAGRTRADEMERVADEVAAALGEGGDSVAVVFPGAGPSAAALARRLDERGIPYTDLIGRTGWPPTELQARRALASFYAGGCRLEGLLELWPLLRALGFVSITQGEARDVCERLFGETQDHRLAAAADRLAAEERPAWREVGRVAGLVLPAWPDPLTLGEALVRYEGVCARFRLAPPPGWSALEAFAEREEGLLPARAILEAILAFHPEPAPVPSGTGAAFARVTLTTVRRAAGVAWSHAVLVHANAGVWPVRREPSCWLGDEDRRALNERGRFSLGLPTTEEAAAIERSILAGIARNTRVRLVLSAALADEAEPETRLSPNGWLERLLWTLGLHDGDGGPERALERLVAAGERPWGEPGHGPPPNGGPVPNLSAARCDPASDAAREASPSPWLAVWRGRRDPEAPFDRFFLADPGGSLRPLRLPARLIERAVSDPAELWFREIARAQRTDWRPLQRSRALLLGRLAHQVLAGALRGEPVQEGFFRLNGETDARAALGAALNELRGRWPANRYWQSFHDELGSVASALLEQVIGLGGSFHDPSGPGAGPFVAVECPLPRGATIPLGSGGDRIGVLGRMDLVLLDRPQWAGARVAVVDFKTGGDELSARAMGARGESLQLGVYLSAVLSAGVAEARVWMVKPEGDPKALGAEALPEGLGTLERLGRRLHTGIYGALTKDRTEFSHPFEWPLACAPVGEDILRRKEATTFGAEGGGGGGSEGDDRGGEGGGGTGGPAADGGPGDA